MPRIKDTTVMKFMILILIILIFIGCTSAPDINSSETNSNFANIEQKISSITPMMINLGYYIKAIEIFAFKPVIEEIISKK